MAAQTGLPAQFHVPVTALTATVAAVPSYLGDVEGTPTAAATWSLPLINAPGSPLLIGSQLTVRNLSAFNITLTPTAPDTINGLSSLIVYPFSTLVLSPNGSTWVPTYRAGGDFSNVHIQDTTQSTSPTTGAFTDAGGAGISGDLWAGGAGHFGYTGNVDPTAPVLAVASGGTDGTTATIQGAQTANIILNTPTTLPGGSGTISTNNSTETLTGKTITDPTDVVTASSLFSGGSTNTVGVAAAANPTTGQVLTATSGTTATWQNPGSLGYASFYGTAPSDYGSQVAVGAALDFPHAGATGGLSPPTRSSAGVFNLPTIGTYVVNFVVGITEAGQLQVSTTHLGAVVNGTVGRATTNSPIVMNSLYVTTTTANDTLSVRNPAGNAAALTVTSNAGGTVAVAANLSITRIA